MPLIKRLRPLGLIVVGGMNWMEAASLFHTLELGGARWLCSKESLGEEILGLPIAFRLSLNLCNVSVDSLHFRLIYGPNRSINGQSINQLPLLVIEDSFLFFLRKSVSFFKQFCSGGRADTGDRMRI